MRPSENYGWPSSEAEVGQPHSATERGLELVNGEPRRSTIRSLLLLAVWVALGMFVCVYYRRGLLAWLEGIGEFGIAGGLFFSALYLVSCIFLIPGGILAPAAGFIFGPFWGFVVIVSGATLGAVSAFVIGRYFVRDSLRQRMLQSAVAEQLLAAVESVGWKAVVLSRLCLFIPFRLSNYLFSAARISIVSFGLATFVGVFPTAAVYVYAGSLLRSLADLHGGGNQSSSVLSMYALPLGLSALVLWYLVSYARGVLERAADSSRRERLED